MADVDLCLFVSVSVILKQAPDNKIKRDVQITLCNVYGGFHIIKRGHTRWVYDVNDNKCYKYVA